MSKEVLFTVKNSKEELQVLMKKWEQIYLSMFNKPMTSEIAEGILLCSKDLADVIERMSILKEK